MSEKMVRYSRYKHTHDFCNELADLWVEYAPKMRFSQIIVGLNKASDRPRQLTYELEEAEMMDILRHFFKNPYQKSKEDDSRCENLTERWETAVEELRCNSESDVFDLPALTALLKETWQYFMDTMDCFGFDNAALPIIGAMYVLLNRTMYPKGVKLWKYQAYMIILEGLLQTLNAPLQPIITDKNTFFNGFISVTPDAGVHHERPVHISEFDNVFAELSQELYERDYIELYDENGEEY